MPQALPNIPPSPQAPAPVWPNADGDRLAGATPIGGWAWHAEDRCFAASPETYRILGITPGRFPLTFEYLLDRVHPEDRHALRRAAEGARLGFGGDPLDFRVLMGDCSLRHLQAIVTRDLGVRGSPAGTLCDLTSQRELEQHLSALTTVGESVAFGGDELDRARLLQGLTAALDLDGGSLWVPDDGLLVLREDWRADRWCPVLPGAGQPRIQPGETAPGIAWRLGAPVSTIEASGRPRAADGRTGEQPARRAGMREDRKAVPGYHGLLAFPALRGDEVVAVVALRSVHRVRLTPRLETTLSSIGRQLGSILGHRRDTMRAPLSNRELEVLQLAADGLSGPAIARVLHLSPSTVKTHFDHAYRKCGVQDRAGAVAAALRRGLIH